MKTKQILGVALLLGVGWVLLKRRPVQAGEPGYGYAPAGSPYIY